MARFVSNHVSRELAALWLFELLMSFCLAYLLLSTDAATGSLPLSTANHALVVALTVGAIAFAIGLYRPEVFCRISGMLINTALGGLLAFPAVWLVSKALGLDADRLMGHDTFWPLRMVTAWIATLFATRLLFMAAVRSQVFVRPVAVLGPISAMPAMVAAIRNGHGGFLEVVSGPAANAGPASLRAAGVRKAVLPGAALDAMPAEERASFAIHGVMLETEGQFWERCLKRVDVNHIDGAWVAVLEAALAGRLQRSLNRAADVSISLMLLTLTLPLMLLTALLVRLDSRGPVLYCQERIGLDGHPFTLFKFRSMRSDAELYGPAWATQHDPRITRAGSFMRRTRIDELPQLINILHGTMSFIGPRPERPHFVEQLSAAIPYYRERARVKPGLTGWAQVSFPYGASVEDARSKLSYDLYYVRHRSPLLDLAILFATVRVILFQEGAR